MTLWKRFQERCGWCGRDALIESVNPLTQRKESNASHPKSTSFTTSRDSGPQQKARLTQEEIKQRTDVSKKIETMHYGGMTLQYCYVSQRGFYPDDPNKENQDCYCTFPEVTLKGDSKSKIAFFGVFDGHGKSGHHCSRFVRDELPKNLFEKLESMGKDNTVKGTEKAILQAHKVTSERLLKNPNIECKLSGTTSITVLLRDRKMYVSNVGDSRAIIVSTDNDGKMKVSALSSDHTPYRKDERFRVMKYGARILSLGQLQSGATSKSSFASLGGLNLGEDIDEGGDPPRVWAKEGEYPGTAFTRSFGDQLAEELGVTAEPEVLVREITSNDQYVIIASDGVFEFLTNQMVADIISTTADPIDACRAVVEYAYDLWLQYDVRADDITIVLLKCVDVPDSGVKVDSIRLEEWPRTQSTFDIINSAPIHPSQTVLNDSRPVRRALTREKMKKIITTVSVSDSDDPTGGGYEEPDEPSPSGATKSAADLGAIANAVKLNFLFKDLSETDRKHVIDAMQPKLASAGDWIITQGDKASKYYVVEEGKLEVRLRAPGASDNMGEVNGGDVIHVYDASKGHPGFGELGLLYNKPRAASVIAVTDCKLWTVDRGTFSKYIMASMEAKKALKRLLRTVPLFSCLSVQQIRDLADNMSEEILQVGDCLVQEGEKLSRFFVVLEGECECSMKANSEYADSVVSKTKTKLIPQDRFGEKALLSNSTESSAQSIIALTRIKLLFITRRSFEDCIGKLDPLLEAYQSMSSKGMELVRAPKKFSDIEFQGLISTSDFSSIFLGQFDMGPMFSSSSKLKPNLTVRSYNLKEVDKNKSNKHSVINAIEALKAIGCSSDKCYFVFRMVAIFHESNALHLVMDMPVVADLNSFLRARSEDGSLISSESVVCNIAVSVFSGLEYLHGKGMIYRSVHPEGIYIDAHGQAILGSFRATKVGVFGTRTYTICGASEYLAPEIINRQGHSMPVDLWALGVLLYEIAVGIHPFATEGASEVEVFSRISSYGTRAFPKLDFPPYLSEEVIDLIEKLLVPIPDLRLGAGPGGYKEVKEMFQDIDWSVINTKPPISPLATTAAAVVSDMLLLGVEEEKLAPFKEEYNGKGYWDTISMI